jgi:hypothetical protein
MEEALAGRKPLRERAMTNAERQARYRAAHADGSPKVRYRRPGDRRSRPQRWRDAVDELVNLQVEYRAWLESLPASLAESAIAEALQAIVDLDLSELEGIEPPRRLWARFESSIPRRRRSHTTPTALAIMLNRNVIAQRLRPIT